MSASKGKKKDDKPPPATGPGSKVKSLPPDIRRHILPRPDGVPGYDLRWSTTSIKNLPKEVFLNEEITETAKHLEASNNRIKKLPGTISTLKDLEVIDLKNNIMSSLPGALTKLKALRSIDVSGNTIKKLPGTMHKAAELVDKVY